MQNTFLHMFTHFYTCVSGFFLGLHMCKWIFLGLHMCKWIFLVYTCVSGFFLTYTFLHILTHPYTSIHIQVYCGLFGSCFRTMTSYDMKPNRIRMTRRTPLVVRGCSILRPFGQQLSHFYFFQIKIVQPSLKTSSNFQVQQRNSKKTYETKVSTTQKIKMQNAMMKKKLLKYLSFHVQNNLK